MQLLTMAGLRDPTAACIWQVHRDHARLGLNKPRLSILCKNANDGASLLNHFLMKLNKRIPNWGYSKACVSETFENDTTNIFLKMPLHPTHDSNMAAEVGHILKLARTQQGLSLEEVCKKMGTRVDQIQALELGNDNYFKNGSHPFIWFARLYAKKLGVDLAGMLHINNPSAQNTVSDALTNGPGVLLKNSTRSQND